MMAQQNDLAIKTMCINTAIQTIKLLSEKYSFDAEEAERFLNLAVELKITHLEVNGDKPEKETKTEKADKKADKKAEKAKKKADKKAAKEAKPKRKLTGYLLFINDQRQVMKEMMEADLAEGEKLMSTNVTVELAKLWKALTDEEKAEWNATAKADDTESE